MSKNNDNWLQDLFIEQAKPALRRHSGGGGTSEEELNAAYESGKTDGLKSEYDRFWDRYQQNGNRGNYSNAFAGVGWTTETFKPKYDIRPYAIANLFMDSEMNVDLAQLLEDCGIELDFSGVIGWAQYTFNNTKFTRLGRCDLSNATMLSTTFYNNKHMHTIDELCVSEKAQFNNLFADNTALENLTVTGTIGNNGFNVQWSTKLTHDSIMSIINALKDYSEDTSGTEWKIVLGSDNIAKLTTEELNTIYNKGWNVE